MNATPIRFAFVTTLLIMVGASVAGAAVDVQPINVTRGSSSVTAGGSLDVSWQIRNNGNTSAASSYSQVRITTSSTSYGNSSNNVGSAVATGTISAGATKNQSKTVTVPTTPGTYYVWVIADNTSVLTQTNTSNDFAKSSSFTVTAATTVDVQPLNVTRASSSVTAGGSLDVSWQIRNNGTGSAASSYSQVRITSSSTSYGTSSNNAGSAVATGTISAGSTINQSKTVTVPTTPGTYYVWVIADNTSVLTQTNTSNDFANSSSFTVTSVVPTTYAITPNPATVDEAAGSLTFTITRSGGTPAETIYASTTTAEGSLNNGDYTGIANQSVTFSSGQTSRTVSVSITNDSVVESSETFGFIVQRNTGDPVSTYLAKSSYSIVDNDSTAQVPGAFTLSNGSPYWDSNPPAGPVVRLNWTPSSGAANYDIYRNGNLYASNVVGTTYLNNLNLIGGQNYSYYIVAKSSSGTRQSNTRNITMPSAPQTPATTLTGVTVGGPSNVSPGSSSAFTATAQFSNGSTQDVTNFAQWSVTGGPSGTLMNGATLTAGSGSAASATVAASYGDNSGTKTASRNVSIGIGLSVTASFSPPVLISGSTYRVNLSATATGGVGAISFLWNANGQVLTGQSPQWTISSNGGTYPVSVQVTDGQGQTKGASFMVSIDKAPLTNQPEKVGPASAVYPGKFLDGHGNPFEFDLARTTNGLIVITHGLNDKGGAAWITNLVAAIENKIPEAQRPNIVIYDWEEDNNPTSVLEAPETFLNVTDKFGLLGKAGSKLLSDALMLKTAADLIGIRPIAQVHGQYLGERLLIEANAIPQRVDFSKKIHFVGHSAGGFVVGEAAWVIRADGIAEGDGKIVDRVTMLDTPYPFPQHITTLTNPTVVERYVSSILGAVEWPSTKTLEDNDYRWVLATFDSFPSFSFFRALTPLAHADAHEWYRQTVLPDTGFEYLGFYNSPFVAGPMASGGMTPSPMALRFSSTMEPSALSANILEGFSTFGMVTGSNGMWSISEQSDAGIFKEITIPPGVKNLRFKYRFSGTGDGDFLGVRFGPRPEIYLGPDLSISRDRYFEAEVELGQYAEMTDQLVFTLVSRGDSGAVLEIKDIEITESDDPDGDGLSVPEEQALGTNSQNADSDGDGWSDFYEANVSQTSPVLTDTDGDGAPDPSEALAGTDPRSNLSVFRVRELSMGSDMSFTLRWSGVTGKTYRVVRSSTPAFTEYDVIATKITGVEPLTTYTDAGSNLVGMSKVFYRIEVE